MVAAQLCTLPLNIQTSHVFTVFVRTIGSDSVSVCVCESIFTTRIHSRIYMQHACTLTSSTEYRLVFDKENFQDICIHINICIIYFPVPASSRIYHCSVLYFSCFPFMMDVVWNANLRKRSHIGIRNGFMDTKHIILLTIHLF